VTEYVDFAEYYDGDHAITEDIPFYLDLARRSESPVLEVACGTGRILIPLAQAGFQISGIDISANMLNVCRTAVAQLGLESHVKLSETNVADFVLPRRDFRLAFTALRSFMHLLTPAEQLACLRCVRAHLVREGHFVISLIAPDPARLSEAPSDEFDLRREFDLPNGHHVRRKERLVEHDRLAQVRRFEFKFEELNRSGELIRERVVPLALRYSFREELERRLLEAGFRPVEVYGGYDRRPYDGTGEMVVVAQRGGA
jgi:SAM-dependent methyltransferase